MPARRRPAWQIDLVRVHGGRSLLEDGARATQVAARMRAAITGGEFS
jgi:hypothetical protein